MKVGVKIILSVVAMGIILLSIASVIYLQKLNVEKAIKNTNSATEKVANAFGFTSKVSDLRYTSTYALSILNLGTFSNSTPLLNGEKELFDSQMASAVNILGQLPSSTETKKISSDLKSLRDVGDLALTQTGMLIKYKGLLSQKQNALAEANQEFTSVDSQMSHFMTIDQNLADSIQASYTALSSKANGLSSLSGTKLKEAQTQIASSLNALPIKKLSIVGLEYLLNDLANTSGVSQANQAVVSMELATRQIRLANGKPAVETQLENLGVYVQNFKTVLGMGLLNYADVTYGNILLSRYTEMAKQYGDLILKDHSVSFEIQNLSNVIDGYSNQITSQQNLISNLLTNKVMESFNSIVKTIGQMFDEANTNAGNAVNMVNQGSATISNAFNSMITVALIVLVIGAAVLVFIAIILTLNFTSILKRLEGDAKKISDGNLNFKIERSKRKDEFGSLQNTFGEMLKSLKGVVGNVKGSSKQVNSGSQNLSAAIEENSATIQEISANLERMRTSTHDAVKSLNDMVNRFSDLEKVGEKTSSNAQVVRSSADDSIKIAREGQKQVETLVGDLTGTKETILKGARSIEQLKEAYASISRFVETIESIAEQTNLLALNAAIEAARAGEAGKGFAVVAEEIRNLAEESNRAAEEIRNQIKTLQSEVQVTTAQVESGANSIETLSRNANSVVEAVRQMLTTFDDIRNKVQEIAEGLEAQKIEMSDISTDSKQRAQSFSGMVDMLEMISESLNESGKAVADIANTAEELAVTAENMEGTVNRFKFD